MATKNEQIYLPATAAATATNHGQPARTSHTNVQWLTASEIGFAQQAQQNNATTQAENSSHQRERNKKKRLRKCRSSSNSNKRRTA